MHCFSHLLFLFLFIVNHSPNPNVISTAAVEDENSNSAEVQNDDLASILGLTTAAQQRRIKELGNIVEKQGDLQAYEVFTFREFDYFYKNGWPFKPDQFVEAEHSLVQKLHKFAKRQPILHNLINFEIVEKMLAEEKNNGKKMHEALTRQRRRGEKFVQIFARIRQSKPWHAFLMDCKFFMFSLFAEPEIDFNGGNGHRKFWEGGEGSFLNIASYMVRGEYQTVLENIWILAQMQNDELDQLALAQMYAAHLANGQNGGREKYKKALVVGAGPIGMYSAFQLFLAGMEVTLVNDRAERYSRKQPVYLDLKWMVQLRLLLGTKFDEFFPTPLEKENLPILPNESGEIQCKNLEKALKERLVDLISFVEHQEEIEGKLAKTTGNKDEHFGQNGPLKLIYEAAFVNMEDGEKGFLAELGTPEAKTNFDQKEFNENLVQIEAQKYLEEGYSQNDANGMAKGKMLAKNTERIKNYMGQKTENKDNGNEDEGFWEEREKGMEPKMGFRRGRHMPEEKITFGERAELEFSGKALALRKLPKVPFDVLICAGGANDRVRDQILGKPKLILSKPYGVAIMEKGIENAFIFADGPMDKHLEIEMEKMWGQIKKQKFEEFLREFSPVKKDYSNFSKLLMKNMLKDGTNKKELIRLSETPNLIYLIATTPPAMVELFSEFEREKIGKIQEMVDDLMLKKSKNLNEQEFAKIKKENGKKMQKIADDFKKFRKKIERKWFMAVFEYCLGNIQIKMEYNVDKNGGMLEKLEEWKAKNEKIIQNPPKNYQKLFFDENNTSTFALDIKLEENGFRELVGTNGSGALVLSLGDSLASPHFMSGSGLSSGRLGVENAIRAIKNYNQGKINEKWEFFAILKATLEDVKERVEKKAVEFETFRKPNREKVKILSKLKH